MTCLPYVALGAVLGPLLVVSGALAWLRFAVWRRHRRWLLAREMGRHFNGDAP